MFNGMREKFIGNKVFYKTVFMIMLPILFQNAITNFVNMLDNIMIGQVGTLQMSAVSIVNQLIFIFNLLVFGSLSGAGIFSSQFFGNKNYEGVKQCFRFKLLTGFIVGSLGTIILYLYAEPLTSLYMNPETNSLQNIKETLTYASSYIRYIIIGLLPFAVSQCISSTIRESGETILPMISSLCAIFINLIFNYLLIFGHLGFPKLGTDGAAIATSLSRFVELTFLLVVAYKMRDRLPAFKKVLPLKIEHSLAKKIISKGTPLAMNEFFWSFGVAAINQCYSTRGLNVVAANNIAGTIYSLFIMACIAMGNTIAIIIGQKLGADQIDEAIDHNRKLTFLSFSMCIVLSAIMLILAKPFPNLYNVTSDVKSIATTMILVDGFLMPVAALYNSAYFTLRSGGKALLTSLFDSGLTCLLALPVAFILSRFTSLPLVPMYIIVRSLDIIKGALGIYLIRKKVWINRLI